MNKNLKTILIIGGIIVAALVIVPTVIGSVSGWQGYGYGMMGPGMMGNFGWGGFTGMGIVMVIFWGLVIWGVVALSRGAGLSCCTGSSNHSDSALEVLKKRYAQGEIDKKEFEEKKKDFV
ncbi:MAG: SHOCT domain-containing protein [Dehalococcoidales bacterium]|nr:SHOCT domain-containing protein [Dehalococcoidales bacterium]